MFSILFIECPLTITSLRSTTENKEKTIYFRLLLWWCALFKNKHDDFRCQLLLPIGKCCVMFL